MKLLFICVFAAAGLQAQTPGPQGAVACKLTIEGSATAKKLTGGKLSLYKGRIEGKNYSSSTTAITGVDIDLSLSTIDTLAAIDAQALMNLAYTNQPGQRAARDLAAGIGALGALEAAKVLGLAAGPFGWIVAGGAILTQYLIPLFTAGQPALDLSNPCDSLQTTLTPGQSFACTIYIQKPPKKAPRLPSAITFDLALAASAPNGLPPAPAPLMLRPLAH